MSRRRWGVGAIALVSAVTLTLAGCSAGGDSNTGGGSNASAIITANGTEPQNPLLTFGTTETGGGRILTSLYAGLVSYKADGTIQNEVASSIESDDNVVWTITVADGWKFTNGEEITAQTFVDTWTAGAQDANGAYWFYTIEGATDDGSTAPTGLAVVDDMTFTVTLKAPDADFPLRLGYTAYMPLPSVAFEDLEAFGENPVGNGPYMLDGEGAWRHNEGINLVPNPDYKGVREVKNDGLNFVFYTSLESAYADAQGGNLDVLDTVPDTAFATYETDFPERSVNQPAAIYQGFNIPFYLPDFGNDEEGQLRRAAISMAINREEITDTIFQGTRTPATDFTSPVVEGWSDDLPGSEVLEYNPEEAKAKWAEAEAIKPYTGPFTLAYNSDGGHQAWVDAVANSISNTLGIEASGLPFPTFAAALDLRTTGTLTGATRAGWQADYPSQGNFLSAQYSTGGSSNYEGYTNPEFDGLLAQAAAAPSVEDAAGLYEQAQEILMRDLPSIPLWYANAVGVWSEGVDNVVFGWDSVPLYEQITKG
ncbi:ABC transporter substrate-binding protein [Microbacterium sp. H37-C3]|uniref:peptide ABC transporter substrate-binding protein n=1 Tax=Microbacterium sp. H37-C3 TaxID=3004354 RepID=UPI0022AF50E9|nr:ABC transporter substrate-binding protein [Microbacterium sp. H37-C3]MCZ4066197.1 ABC transporter substrate-binding protein [Microbacterium sp. H37-C3]